MSKSTDISTSTHFTPQAKIKPQRRTLGFSSALYQTLQDYIYVPADFDTNRKSLLRRRSAEKGLKYKGLLRSIADFGSPYFYVITAVLAGGYKPWPEPWSVRKKEKLKGGYNKAPYYTNKSI